MVVLILCQYLGRYPSVCIEVIAGHLHQSTCGSLAALAAGVPTMWARPIGRNTIHSPYVSTNKHLQPAVPSLLASMCWRWRVAYARGASWASWSGLMGLTGPIVVIAIVVIEARGCSRLMLMR